MPIKNAPALQVLGKLTFEPSDPPRPLDTYVLQRVAPGLGNVASDPTASLQIRRHVIPADARSPAQLALRQRVQQANRGWRLLTLAERADWKKAGARRKIPGYNAYVSAWLKGELHATLAAPLAHGMRRPPHLLAPQLVRAGAKRAHRFHYRFRLGLTPTKVRGTRRGHFPFPHLTGWGLPSHARPTRVAHITVIHWPISTQPGHARGSLRAHQSAHRIKKV